MCFFQSSLIFCFIALYSTPCLSLVHYKIFHKALMKNTSVFTEDVIKHDHAKVLLINQYGHKLNLALKSTNQLDPNFFLIFELSIY